MIARLVLPLCALTVAATAQMRIPTGAQLPGATQGQNYTQSLIATGGTAPYTFAVSSGNLPSGVTLQSNGQFQGAPGGATGNYTFEVIARDTSGAIALKNFSLNVAPTALTLQVTGNGSTVQLTRYLELSFAGQGGSPPYRYILTTANLPRGTFFQKTTQFSAALPNGFSLVQGTPQQAGAFNGTMRVVDSLNRTAEAPFNFTVTSAPLTITTATLPSNLRGSRYDLPISFDGGSLPVRFDLAAGTLPQGFELTSGGRIRGRSFDAPTVYNFTVRATDALGATVSRPYSIALTLPTATVAFTTDALLDTAVLNFDYSTPINIDGIGGSPPVGFFRLANGSVLPTGLSLATCSGTSCSISGNPSVSGTFQFTIEYVAAGVPAASQQFTLRIAPSRFQWINDSTSLSVGRFARLLDAGTQTIGGTPAGQVEFVAGAWGPGMAPSGLQVLGNPSLAGIFSFSFEVRSTDGQIAGSSTFYQVFPASPLFRASEADPPNGVVGVRYRYVDAGCNPTCFHNGGIQPYRWSVAAGPLPPGLSLTADGELGGIPTQAGTFPVTFRINDAQNFLDLSYSIVIQETSGSLSLLTTSPLPQGSFNVPYSTLLATSGGTPPIGFRLVSGALPPGLTLSPGQAPGTAILSGIPTAGGTYNFTIAAIDSNPDPAGGPITATRAYSLFIFAPTPPPGLTSLNPSFAIAGSPAFSLTLTGSNFSSPQVFWNGQIPLASAPGPQPNTLVAQVPANLVAFVGLAQVQVRNGDGQTSNSLPFPIRLRAPVITQLNPPSATAGTTQVGFFVNGQDFRSSDEGTSVVLWAGQPVSTSFLTPQTLFVTVPPDRVPPQGSVPVQVRNPDGQLSNIVSFSFNPLPILTSLNPSAVITGSADLVVRVLGANLLRPSTGRPQDEGTVVVFGDIEGGLRNGQGGILETAVLTTTELTARIPASELTVPRTVNVYLLNPDGGRSQTLPFTIQPPPPSLTRLDPNTTPVTAGPLVVTITGDSFAPGQTAFLDETALTTTVNDNRTITAVIPAGRLANPGTLPVTVRTPAGATSNALQLTVTGAGPQISALDPASRTAGLGAFPVAVNGGGFVAQSVVLWNGAPLATTFGSAASLTAQVPAILTATPGSALVTVRNPDGLTSAARSFAITAAGPAVSQLTPSSAQTGSAAVPLTISGSGFQQGAVARFGTIELTPTQFVNSSQLTALIPASALLTAAVVPVTVRNPDGQTSAGVNFTVGQVAPAPQLTLIAPTGVQAGSPPVTLTLTGANFQPGAIARLNNADLQTAFASATGLTAQIPAALLTAPGSASITVRNPDNQVSNPQVFTISALPPPVLLTLTPASSVAGAAAFLLTADGTGFQQGAVIRWQGQDLATTFVSAARLTATVSAQLVQSAGSVAVTVRNPDTQLSNPLSFAINAAAPPVITSLSPPEALTTNTNATIDVLGQNFLSGAVVLWNGQPMPSTFVSATQMQVSLPAGMLLVPGAVGVQVRNPNHLLSNAVTFLIRFVVPRIVSMTPLATLAGNTDITLVVTAENIRNGSLLLWNGSPLQTTFQAPNVLTAAVTPAFLLANPGTANVAVRNPDGQTSASLIFQILPQRPAITSLDPGTVVVQQPDVTLRIRGSFFRSGAQARLNGTPLSTFFLSANELTAPVPQGLLNAPGPANVVVANPEGQISDSATLTILPSLTPEITALAPRFAPVSNAELRVTINGRNFVPGAQATADGTPLNTSFGSSQQVTAAIPAVLLGSARTLQLAVRNPDGKTSAPAPLVIGDPLRITTTELPNAVRGVEYRFPLAARGGVPRLRWRVAAGETLPAGLLLADDGLLSGAPTVEGSFAFTVELTDSVDNADRMRLSLRIESRDLDISSTSPLPPATTGVPYAHQLRSNAAAGLPLTWSVIEGALPGGLLLSERTGEISGIPEDVPEGAATDRAASVPVPFNFRIQVAAPDRNPGRKAFELTLLPGTGAFRITTASPLPPGRLERPVFLQIATAGGAGVVTFAITGRLPRGIDFNDDGQFSGTPEETGVFALVVTARDGQQRQAAQQYTWQILAAGEGPVITSGPLLPVLGVQRPVDLLVEAARGRRPFTWSVVSGTLPRGITFDPVTGRLSGTATVDGLFRFTVRVVDADGNVDTRTLELPVTASGAPLEFLTQALPGAAVGRTYNAELAARGGREPYRFSVVSGALPQGIVLSANRLTGTAAAAAPASFEVQVSDSFGFRVTRAFTIAAAFDAVPALLLTGLPDRINPGQQPQIGLEMASPYPVELTGTIDLEFTPQPAVAGIETSLQFSTGGLSVAFTIPAGQTRAVFPQSPLALQTGTVAGALQARVTVRVAGQAAPLSNRPDRNASIVQLAPVVASVTLERGANGFSIIVTGFSTTREVQEAVVVLTPAPGRELQATTLVVPLAAAFQQWYASPQSLPFGTQFRLILPFSGDGAAVQSATVRLRNSIGESR